jgi:hypothetical protein
MSLCQLASEWFWGAEKQTRAQFYAIQGRRKAKIRNHLSAGLP